MSTTEAPGPGPGPVPAAPAPPEPAAEVFFGERLPIAVAFAAHLATSAVERGLVGPREVPRLWTRHILNCAALAPLLPESAVVVDVGSGAGLPGLVLAIAREDVRVTLVEPLLRRVAWLDEVVGDLGLANVTVHRARAEEVDQGWADVATARAVAPLAKLTAWCLPLVRPEGRMLAIKGQTAAAELAEAQPVLPVLGAASWRSFEVGGDLLDEPTTVVEVRKGTPAAGARPTAPAGRGSRRRRSTRR